MTVSTEVVIRLRTAKGWSQSKLSAMSGLSERTIQRVERDGTCSLETRLALASAFNIAAEELAAEAQPLATAPIDPAKGTAAGWFLLGIATVLVIMISVPQGWWDVGCALLVAGFSLAMALIDGGLESVLRLLTAPARITKDFAVVGSELSLRLFQVSSMIRSLYVGGIVITVIAATSLAFFSPVLKMSVQWYALLISRPLIYSLVFAEFWFRPYARKLAGRQIALSAA